MKHRRHRHVSRLNQGFWTGVMVSLSIDIWGGGMNATEWRNPLDSDCIKRLQRHTVGMLVGFLYMVSLIVAVIVAADLCAAVAFVLCGVLWASVLCSWLVWARST